MVPQAANIANIVCSAIAGLLLALALLSAVEGRVYRHQNMRFAILLLAINLVHSISMPIGVNLSRDTVSSQRGVCGVEVLGGGSFFGQLFAESAILLLARHGLVSGKESLEPGVERRYFAVTIVLALLCGAGLGTYCFTECVQPTSGTEAEFTTCWQHDMWETVHIIWLVMLTVPLGLWLNVFLAIRKAARDLVFHYDSMKHSALDVQRGVQLLKMRAVIIDEVYRPLRFYPPLFLLFGLVLLINTVVSAAVPSPSNLGNSSNPSGPSSSAGLRFSLALVYIYPIRNMAVALAYFANTPHAVADLRRALCRPRAKRRHVRIREAIEVRLIEDQSDPLGSVSHDGEGTDDPMRQDGSRADSSGTQSPEEQEYVE